MTRDLPPPGTRWGDLSLQQRRDLPRGTVLVRDKDQMFPRIRKGASGWQARHRGVIWSEYEIGDDRVIASYRAMP